MRSVVAVFGVVLLVQACAGPLYESKAAYTPEVDQDSAPSEVYVMTYYTKVDSTLVVAIQKTAAQPNAGGGGQKPQQNPPKADGGTSASQAAVTVSVVNEPSRPRYLYFKKSPLYGSSVEFTTDPQGLATKSDTSSQQMVEAALNEIAQTAEQLAAYAIGAVKNVPANNGVNPVQQPQLRGECMKKLAEIAPAYQVFPVDKLTGTTSGPIADVPDNDPIPNGGGKVFTDSLRYYLAISGLPVSATSQQQEKSQDYGSDANDNDDKDHDNGFWVYDPTPLTVTPMCKTAQTEAVPIAVAQIVVVYKFRHRVNPRRNFWTSPQDTYTLADGILVGHKYTDQSAVKTVVDILTAPIRSALPSSQTTTSVSVQSTAGKPDQSTSTTSTVLSAPKQQ